MSKNIKGFQHLTQECGHHCIAQKVGRAPVAVYHCYCSDCHNNKPVKNKKEKPHSTGVEK